MAIEEVFKGKGDEKWRGLTSGFEYQDHEVDEQCQGVAFGDKYSNRWSADFSEEPTAAKPADGRGQGQGQG